MLSEKKVHVDDLRIGMFVTRLDRPWLDTPFLLQGFAIKEARDVRKVAEYCEHVWVDCKWKPKGSSHSSNEGTATFARSQFEEYDVPVEEEHQRVRQDFQQARRFISNFLEEVRDGGDIDQVEVKETVETCVDSVLRNPNALLWMVRIREKSAYTAEHSLNVCILAIAFGRYLGLPRNSLELLGMAGLLHDVGKMRVPKAILDKPGKLTDREMRMMKAHAVHGRNLLQASPELPSDIIDAAYSHHERVDGLGYPRKISGADIALTTKIISIVDAYDAMTADRAYARTKSTTEALSVIYDGRGSQFDEGLALKFIESIGLFPVGSVVELNNGEIGIVVEVNPQRRHLPRVALVLDQMRQKKDGCNVIDLSHVECGVLTKEFLVKRAWPDGAFGIDVRAYQDDGLFFSS